MQTQFLAVLQSLKCFRSTQLFSWVALLLYDCKRVFASRCSRYPCLFRNAQIFFAMHITCLQLTNLFWDAQIFFAIDKSFSQSTNLFHDRQNFKPINKSFSQCTNLSHDAQIFLAIDKSFSRCTNLFSCKLSLSR